MHKQVRKTLFYSLILIRVSFIGNFYLRKQTVANLFRPFLDARLNVNHDNPKLI